MYTRLVPETPEKVSVAAKKEYLQYGGQAIIEGVMMRSPRYFAIACRAPNGDIVLTTEALEKTWMGRQKWLKWPFFRGSLALLDTMALAIKSMRFAANVQTDPKFAAADEAAAAGKPVEAAPSKRVQDAAIGATMVVSLGLGLFLFNYLPNLIAQSLERFGASGMLINFATEVVKVVIFIAYLWAIGKLPDVTEVFKYHGAEHKAINAMEADEPLNLDSVQNQTRLHPRCGTSFAICVLLVSMLVFTFVPRYPFGQLGYLADATVRFGVELVLLPLISGIAYELIRAAGRARNSAVFQTLIWPGLMSQYLTTREPEQRHVEVSMLSLQAVIEAELTGKLAQSVEELDSDPRGMPVTTGTPATP